MDGIQGILKTVVSDLMKRSHESEFPKIKKALDKAVGAKAAKHIKIVYLTKEKIRVNVDNSVWLYDMTMRKAKIQSALKKTLGLDDIRFRLGSIK